MEVRSIKNVDFQTWKKFKSLANQEGMSMAILLNKLLNEYEKKKNDVWGKVFEESANFSKKEAKDFQEDHKKLRKEKGFRV